MLAYVVVLGLFVQFFPAVISESFAITLLTAVLLKVVLEVVLAAKQAVLRRAHAATTTLARIVAILTLVLVLPGSKFVVLWLTDLVFGDAVSLGSFVSVTVLIIALMLARAGVRLLFRQPPDQPKAQPRASTAR
mgnify:FL=1